MKPNRLDELRSILLRTDLDKLEDLSERIEVRDRRAEDVAEVLPESIAASVARDSRLIGALRTPLRQCVSESVRENPEEYADALFPVMGPAIRRSITEALRGWTQQFNQVIEQSLSPRGIAWRFQAWRAGMPFGQYVLQHTLLFRVEDVYLIHSQSGLLVAHATQRDVPIKDEDAVSAMFTAIQHFVRDSFAQEQRQGLTTAELGELTLWAVHGPSTTIVAVIRGVPPAALRAKLESTLERIEAQRGRALQAYAGDRESMSDLEPELESCLMVSLRDAEQGKRFSPALGLLIIAGLLLVAWIAHGLWMQNKLARVESAFNDAPGIHVTGIERNGDTLVVRGLRDQLAASPDFLAAAAGWEGNVSSDFSVFLSLDREFVLARAINLLKPPESVEMNLIDGTLEIAGRAPPAWVADVESQAMRVPGIERVDRESLTGDLSNLMADVIEALDPPDSVLLELDGSILHISGTAPKEWSERARDFVLPVGIDSMDLTGLDFSERQAMIVLEGEVERLEVIFDEGSSAVAPREEATVTRLADAALAYGLLARELDLTPVVTVTGHSNGSGTRAVNISFERDRAESLAAALREAGVPDGWVRSRSQLESQATGVRRPLATVRLTTAPATAPIIE